MLPVSASQRSTEPFVRRGYRGPDLLDCTDTIRSQASVSGTQGDQVGPGEIESQVDQEGEV